MKNEELYKKLNVSPLLVFISHRNEDRALVHDLKNALKQRRINSFVAHDDIKEDTLWLTEMHEKIMSCHLLVAYMTEKFHDSYWTNQEIGIAIGRNIPIRMYRLGEDPKGFRSQIQAIRKFGNTDGSVDNSGIACDIANSIHQCEDFTNPYILTILECLEKSSKYADSSSLSSILEALFRRDRGREFIYRTEVQEVLQRIIANNRQVYESNIAMSKLKQMLIQR